MDSFEFRIYKDVKREWRWNFVAENGETIADSAEGYKEKRDCLAAIKLVKENASKSKIDDPWENEPS